MTTPQEIQEHRSTGSWRQLESLAHELVTDACARAGGQMTPVLGGGTRLMLAAEHRICHDISLFITDTRWIGHLSPRLNDRFKHRFVDYAEAPTSLKLITTAGEIDFIVGASLLHQPVERVADCVFELESVGEVLAKTLFHRGWALRPQDLFDWWSIESRGLLDAGARKQIDHLIQPRLDVLLGALKALPHSAAAQRTWRTLQTPSSPQLAECVSWATDRLSALTAPSPGL